MIEEHDAELEENHAGRFELKPTLVKVWHAPDNFRSWIVAADASPGIIIAAIVLIIGIFSWR